MLKYLGVSKSGYYDWLNRKPSNQSILKEKVKDAIQKIYDENRQIYGAPKITRELHKKGFNTAERTVQRYMKEMGIRACWIKPYTITTHSEDFSNRLKNILFGLTLGLVNLGCTSSMIRSLASLPSNVFFPIYNTGVVLVGTAAGILFFREKMKWTQVLGLILAVIAVILLKR